MAVDPSTVIIGGISGVLAYIGGVLTKPIQDRLTEKRESGKLHKALYVEIGKVLSHCQYVLDELDRDITITNYWTVYIKGFWPSACFEAAQSNPITLNLLADTKGINHFFKAWQTFNDHFEVITAEHNPTSVITLAFLATVLAIRHIVEIGELSKDLLVELGDEKSKLFLARDALAYRERLNEFERKYLPKPPVANA